jgi:hypothetical protein
MRTISVLYSVFVPLPTSIPSKWIFPFVPLPIFVLEPKANPLEKCHFSCFLSKAKTQWDDVRYTKESRPVYHLERRQINSYQRGESQVSRGESFTKPWKGNEIHRSSKK